MLLHPPRPGGRGTNLVPPVGLLYLASALRAAGHSVALVDAARTGMRGKRLAQELGVAGDVLMVSAFTSDIAVLQEDLPVLAKSMPHSEIWLGGPHASCVGATAFEHLPEVDAVFLGEAEESVVEAMEALAAGEEKPPLQGVIWRDGPGSESHRHVGDLASLPMPAWDLAPPGLYRGLPNGVVLRKTPYAPIITTRGCPFRCTFCAGHRITGRHLRHRPLEQVWEEIDLLTQTYGVREIHIEDDNFTLDSDYAFRFCRMALEKNLPLAFSTPNGVRLDTLDHELLEIMRRAGWYIIHCGIESGSDRILRACRKETTTADLLEKIDLIHAHGLPVAGYFILGLPGETKQDMEATIDFALSSGIEWAQFASFLPIPGSEAGDGWLISHPGEESMLGAFHNTACPAPPEGIERSELKALQRKGFLRFYLRPGPILRIISLLLHRGTAIRLLKRFWAYLIGH